MYVPTINSERISLREITTADLEAFYEIYSHPEVMRYWSFPPLANLAAAEVMVNGILKDYRDSGLLKWGITIREQGTLIGTTTLFNVSMSNGRAEVGYALGRAYWGKGYMNETLKALVSHAFGQMGLRRLEADVDPRNASSIKTLERLGFQREGLLRERWHVAGEIQDALFYGLLAREWNR